MLKCFGQFWILFFLLLFSGSGLAAEVDPDFSFARYGNNVLALIRYDIPEDYHAYAHIPGGAGLPTTLVFTLEGEGEQPVLYPAGKPEKDSFDPGVTINSYAGNVALLAILPSGSLGRMYAAKIDMLLCSSRHCMPYKQTLSGQVPDALPLLGDVDWEEQALALLAREGDSSGALSLEEGMAPPPVSARADRPAPMPQTPAKMNAGAEPDQTDGSFEVSLEPVYPDSDYEIYTLGKALFFGLIAGLILNAMPCVLPVLTMKVTGLLLVGDPDNPGNIRNFRAHNLCFAAGVLTLFTILAVLLGAADYMWGQLYQHTGVLLVMLLLVFLMGLSMLGVFTLPALDLRLGAEQRNPRLNSYLTGLVSTFLATPCSGPLLGGVLAWAFTQPMLILMAVFWAVGLGMALPYILFSIWPQMVRALPRGGNWMYVFEHLLGFLLLATALYLLSILPSDKHMQILALLLVVSTSAWLWGKFCGLDAPRLRRIGCGIAGAALIVGGAFWIMRPVPPELSWNGFSSQLFLKDLGQKNMLVEFTADWCPNCKFLEATVLGDRNMRAWQKQYGFELVKVDLTHPDEAGQQLLEELGSKSIPLTAIFPKGPDADRPIVLRDVYGKSTLVKALAKAFGKKRISSLSAEREEFFQARGMPLDSGPAGELSGL